MKHITKLIFLLICFFNKAKSNHQLFDLIKKEEEDKNKHETTNIAKPLETNIGNSIFEIQSNTNEKKNAEKEDISFTQKVEEMSNKTNEEDKLINTSIFSNNDNQKEKETPSILSKYSSAIISEEKNEINNNNNKSLFNNEKTDNNSNIINKNKPEINNLFKYEAELLKPQVELNGNIIPKKDKLIVINDDKLNAKEDKENEEVIKAVIINQENENNSKEKELNKIDDENSKSKNKSKTKRQNKNKNNKNKNNENKRQTKKISKGDKQDNKGENEKKPNEINEKEEEVKGEGKSENDSKTNSNINKLSQGKIPTKSNKQKLLKQTLNEDVVEIQKLKTKVLNLMKMNKNLLIELDKGTKIKKLENEASEDLIQLIQKSENPINFIQKKILKTSNIIQQKLNQKDIELKNQQKILTKNLDFLIEKIQKAKNSLVKMSNDSSLVNRETKKNYETDNLNVKENIQNDGITFVNKVHTEGIDIGNLKFDIEKVLFNNPDSEIIVGSNILSLRELVVNMELMERLNLRCGENIEKCVIYNQEKYEEELANDNRIIEEIKYLRKDSQIN
jgi:hypothetical protein